MTSCEAGGTERQMIELISRLNPLQWHVHVGCLHAKGAWFDRMSASAASMTEFPISGFRNRGTLRQARALSTWCRQHKLTVLHSADLYTNIFALPAAAAAGVPVRVANRREINPDKTSGQIALQRVAYSFAHRVVANSRAAADRLRLERVPQRKIDVIPNGIDSHSFLPHAIRPSLRRVIVVANLRAEKGHEVLIDAAPQILARFPDAQFELVGRGPEQQALQARARMRNVSHAFSFLGFDDNVPARLAAADIFVLPSRSEAFPNAVLEAMTAGLPIVASGVGGILELIDHNRTGLLVPPGHPVPLAREVCRLMADREVAVRLGRQAASEMQSRFYSFDRMTAAFETIYLSELMRRGLAVAGPARVLAS